MYNYFMESIGNLAKFKAKKPEKPVVNKHLHSPSHLLADEISTKLADRKHFAIYLGLANKLDHNFLRGILGQVLEGREVTTPGKLFMYLVKKNRDQNKLSQQATPNK